MNNENSRSDTAHLLVREPKNKLTEQEVEHMEALAEVLYGMFTRQQAAKKPESSLDTVLTSPRVFAPASTAFN
jgi:hypothetical protein